MLGIARGARAGFVIRYPKPRKGRCRFHQPIPMYINLNQRVDAAKAFNNLELSQLGAVIYGPQLNR